MVNESDEKGAKSGIFVALASIGAGKANDTKQTEMSQNIHKIKFKVFVSEK